MVVWSLLLQDDSEGPPFIFCTACALQRFLTQAARFVSGSPPSTTARQFSACPSDSASRRTPCPPEDYKRSGFRFPLAVSGFHLRARVGCSIPSSLLPASEELPPPLDIA